MGRYVYKKSDIRGVFDRIYPTAKNLHLTTIARVLVVTNFNQVERMLGLKYNSYQRRSIEAVCRKIISESEGL